MSSLADRISGLSPEKRELLLKRLGAQSGSAKARQPIERAPRDRENHPLSYAQQRYWFLDQLDPGNPAYNIHFPLTIHDRVERETLERALSELFRRHEALRTYFDLVDGEPVQKVAPAQPFSLREIDVGEAEASERASSHAAEPFDLARGPLLRAELMKLGNDRFVVLLTTHHIVCDRWSLRILVREMLELYHAFRQGKSSPLPPLEHQYLDFAVWQRRHLEGAVLDRHLTFWREQLAGELPVLELPTDHPRPPLQTFRGATRTRWLPKELKDVLARLGQSEQATLFMTVLAAFQVLLYRYTGERDVIVGSPVASRTRPELEPIVGFFANTLVLRNAVEPAESFRQLLRRVRRTSLDAYSHQELPFEKLVEELRPERNLGQNPLFQVLLTFQPAGLPAKGEMISKLGVLPMESRTSQFDLSLYLDDSSSVLAATMEFNTDLFEPSTIERMLGHFEHLLGEVARSPDEPLGTLSMLPEAERRVLLEAWNDTASPSASKGSPFVTERFERQARLTPDALALSFESERLTYAELDRRSSQLAHFLHARGVGAEQIVAVCLSPSVELVVALLAVLKSGACYLPLDPAFPSDRLALMLEDSGASMVLTRGADEGVLPIDGATRVVLDDEPVVTALTKEPSGGLQRVERDAASLAYVIYTSGSTGRPKGVQVPHGALMNLLVSMGETVDLTPSDVLLSVTTFSFDIAALELFLPLVNGALLALLSRDDARDGHALLARAREQKATVVQATPASWRLMVEAGFGREGTDTAVRALCGGEALPPDLAEALVERLSRAWNVYGPTETTIWSTIQRLSPGAPVSLGRPLANTQVYILDDDRVPVPAGVPGEIFIGGAGVTRGYYRRADLTAERFVVDPFSSLPGSRMYRTGDLGRFKSNGEIEYLGRNDFQVKVRGFRIELGEIEEALRRVDGVKSAVALAQRGEGLDTRLVAYFVLEPDQAPTVTELRKALKQKLPLYMVPSSFVSLDAFPLTPNGKIDRRALERTESRGGSGSSFAAPRTDMERLVADLWRDVLKVERVGRHDNFFDLGGHSLLSMKVIARLQEAIGERVNPRELIFQTLEQFAAACEAQRGDRSNGGATESGLGSGLVGRLKRWMGNTAMGKGDDDGNG